jgi:uncharacterized membrane protein
VDSVFGAPAIGEIPSARGHRGPSARTRVLASTVVALLGALAVALVAPWWLVPLSGWDCGALLLLVWIWRSLWQLDGDDTQAEARRENPGRAAADLLLIGASIVSLLAVGLVLVRASKETGLSKDLLIGLCVASVVLAWGVVHTVYTLRYARLYYKDKPQGVDFNEDTLPCYSDFLYLALTIGMTFQVSDTDLTSKAIRRTAIRHALLSYMFGSIIIATTINLLAGLSK